jgi:hypothetical protein
MKGNKMNKAHIKAATKSSNTKSSNKAAREVPSSTKLEPKSNVDKALGKGKGVVGGKKDRLSNEFST